MKHTSLKARLALIQTCSIACHNDLSISLLNNIFNFVTYYTTSYVMEKYTREDIVGCYMRRYYRLYQSRLSENDYITLVLADEILFKERNKLFDRYIRR